MIQSVKRTIWYGLAIWFVWVTLVVATYENLPPAGQKSSLFVAGKWVSLAVLVLTFTVLYMRKVSQSSAREGAVVGAIWMGFVVAFDLAHYAMAPFDVAKYFMLTVPAYLLIPAMTTIIMGALRRRTDPAPTKAEAPAEKVAVAA